MYVLEYCSLFTHHSIIANFLILAVISAIFPSFIKTCLRRVEDDSEMSKDALPYLPFEMWLTIMSLVPVGSLLACLWRCQYSIIFNETSLHGNLMIIFYNCVLRSVVSLSSQTRGLTHV